MSTLVVRSINTTPYDGQKTGTSGLRKKVKIFQQPNYLANWIQSLFDSLLSLSPLPPSTLVVGGDGRYFNSEALQIIIKIAAGNKVQKIVVGQNGILSTPAVSAIIRHIKADGGIILTASHNPGGPDEDFGIKYNVSNGGPAPESVTDLIYKYTIQIKQYYQAEIPNIDLTKIGSTTFDGFVVDVIDSVDIYLSLLKSIFDFNSIKSLFARQNFKFISDSLNGVTGPYAKRIFVDELGADPSSVINSTPLHDFGGLHPDPNLTYAKSLVKLLYSGEYDFGAAFDGDGDRNMILGKKFFVNPSDSLAIIAANANIIPYFAGGLRAIARSMPTSAASDRVAEKLSVKSYQTPTGWKYFGNIMDKYANEGQGQSVICGEESFGTGSDHIREKDGIWAVLAWLSILADANKNGQGNLVSVEDIVKNHWKTYGRNYFVRYDYEGVSVAAGDQVVAHLASQLNSVVGRSFPKHGNLTISVADNFEYVDPTDSSVTRNQGLRFIMADGVTRFVLRLSGTGSSGATIRLYAEKFEPNHEKHNVEPQVALADVLNLALELSNLTEFTGRTEPTVIT